MNAVPLLDLVDNRRTEIASIASLPWDSAFSKTVTQEKKINELLDHAHPGVAAHMKWGVCGEQGTVDETGDWFST